MVGSRTTEDGGLADNGAPSLARHGVNAGLFGLNIRERRLGWSRSEGAR
jgi:hypothetical protein